MPRASRRKKSLWEESPREENRRNRKSFGVTLGAMLALSIACAQESHADGLYIGAGAYLSDIEIAAGTDDDVTPAGFVGYQFLDTNVLMLSGEVGYYDLGASSGDREGVAYSVDASALTLAGVAYVPLGPFFEVYGKAGVAAVEVDTRIGGESRSRDGTETFIGAGVALDLFDTVDFYVEYLQFDNAINSSMTGIGIRFDFF
jgi:opacity protein-like surface antigen